MQRTSLIATVATSALLVGSIAWAGSGGLDDASDRAVEVVATASDAPQVDSASDVPSPGATPTDVATPSDAATPTDVATPSDDPTPTDAATPSDDPTPTDRRSPSDRPSDEPVHDTITASHRAMEAGAITVEANRTRIRLVEVVVADGWRHEVESEGGLEVEVTFRRPGARVDIKAEVEDGMIRFRVRDRRVDERTEVFVDGDGRVIDGDHDRDDDRDDDDRDDDDRDDDDRDDRDHDDRDDDDRED